MNNTKTITGVVERAEIKYQRRMFVVDVALRDDATGNLVYFKARLMSLVKPGDRITVQGIVRAKRVSRKGIPYTALNRVKLLEKNALRARISVNA